MGATEFDKTPKAVLESAELKLRVLENHNLTELETQMVIYAIRSYQRYRKLAGDLKKSNQTTQEAE
jgi:hypothetical protein